ncbi:hypothetical protein NDU88_003127 [Pleurodeles waltl]|uniref:Uncharacterized protein n=1 Tax=Pleurodeles waltl TaxID=8319 RepID=A0AAV7QBV8_PLEWA|nr:hypothetical protein NDU88_003127 [Pleurodeles waltl]
MSAAGRSTEDVNKVTSAESHINLLQSTSKKLEEQIQCLTRRRELMATRLKDQEGRVRKNNLRVLRVQEGPSANLFLKDSIVNTLRSKHLLKFFSTERTHRAPVPLLKLGACQGQSLSGCSTIAIETPSYKWPARTETIHTKMPQPVFPPDFTFEVQLKHCSFDEVKKMLHSKDIKYMMLFPARLWLLAEGQSWHFNTPSEAWGCAEGWHTPSAPKRSCVVETLESMLEELPPKSVMDSAKTEN